MLTDNEAQTLMEARKVLTKLKDTTTGSREAITFLDIVLNDIYEGWMEHVEKEEQ